MDFDVEKLLRSPFIIGAAGSVVALKWCPGDSYLAKAFNAFCGVMVAGYLTPGLTEWLHITSAGQQGGVAFVLGLFGLNLVAALTDGIKSTKFGDILTGWISRR